MEDLKARLLSRKLWFAIAAFATFMAVGDYDRAQALAIAYIGAQGVVDAVAGFKRGQ